jgi:WD40 repeat protein
LCSEDAPPLSQALAGCDPQSRTVVVAIPERVIEFRVNARLVERIPLSEVKNIALTFDSSGRLWGTVNDEVRVWTSRGRQLHTWSNRLVGQLSGRPGLCAVSAGRRLAAVGGRDGMVYLLSAEAGMEAGASVSPAPVRAVAIHTDETLVAAGSDRGELCLVNKGGGVVAKVEGHRDRVQALSWSGNLLASGSSDRTVKLWKCDRALEKVLTLRQPAAVSWLAFHPDGVRLFVLLEGERAVRVWHLDRLGERVGGLGLATELEAIKARPLPQSVPAPAPARHMEAPEGPNGLKAELFADLDLEQPVAVRYDPTIHFPPRDSASLDPRRPQEIFWVRWTGWLKAPQPGRYRLYLSCRGIARLRLDGRLVGICDRKSAECVVEADLSDRPHALRVEYFNQQGGSEIVLRWSPVEGGTVEPVPTWALFHDRAVAEKTQVPPPLLLEAKEIETPLLKLGEPDCAVFTPDGKRLLAAFTSKAVCMTEFPSGKTLQVRPGPCRTVKISVAPDRKSIITACQTDVLLSDLETLKPIRTFREHTHWVERLDVSPDGRFLVTCGVSNDGRVFIWNLATGEKVRQLVGPNLSNGGVAWLPEGNRIVTCYESDSSVRLWNAGTGEEITVLSGGTDRWENLARSPDGKWIALAGGLSRTVRLLTVENDQFRSRWTLRLAGRTTSANFSPDGRWLAVTTGLTVEIRDVQSGALMGMVKDRSGGSLREALFSPDGKYLVTVTAGDDGRIRVWQLTENAGR